jgi:hypothetical protein
MAAGLGALVIATPGPKLRAAEVKLTSAQSDYLEQCGGCHGMQGDTTPAPIPVLRDRVGYFMCTQAGRDYLLRLPNIVNARVDDESLADMMNFVVFSLGGRSAPPNAPRFTTADVARLRPHVMRGNEVVANRAAVVEGLLKQCGAPASLRLAYPGQTKSVTAR